MSSLLNCRILLALVLLPKLAAAAPKRAVIFDNDIAIDDWPALSYMLHHPDTEVLAVTVTGAGEAHCVPGASHAVDLVDISPQKGVPVACGDAEPLDGFRAFPKAWRDDVDKLYGVPLKKSSRAVDKRSAVQLMIDTLSKADRKVTLVVTGNATNVAQALEKEPKIKDKIERIVFMGGSIWAPGNIIVKGFTDNFKNKTAEWNVYVDPLAARMMIQSGVPLTLVGLDATNDVKVTREDAAAFKAAAKTDSARFFSAIMDKTSWFIDSGEYYNWDVLTAAIAMHPEFCKAVALNVDVIVGYSNKTEDGPALSFSKKRWDGRERSNLDPYFSGQTIISDKGSPITVCAGADAKAFKKNFVTIINRP